MLKNSLSSLYNLSRSVFSLSIPLDSEAKECQALTEKELYSTSISDLVANYKVIFTNKSDNIDAIVLVSIDGDHTDTSISLRTDQIDWIIKEKFTDFFEAMDRDESGNIWALLSLCPTPEYITSLVIQIPVKKNVDKYIKKTEPLKSRYYLKVIYHLINVVSNIGLIKGLVQSKQLEELVRCACNLDILNLGPVTSAAVTTFVEGVYPLVQYYILNS